MEYVTSLNNTKLGCIFTSAANLTDCSAAPSSFWQTYVKNSTLPFGYSYELGYLSAADDDKPPGHMTYEACLNNCTASSTCLGITFQSPAPKPKGDVFCYMKSAIHFTPVDPSGNCPSPGKSGQPRCSPLEGEMGLGGYYGHYQGHWLSAMAFLYNNTGKASIKTKAADFVNTLSKSQDAWGTMYPAKEGYLFPYDPIVFDVLEERTPRPLHNLYSVPFYTVHKIMAGMLDQYTHAGNKQALKVVLGMARWVQHNVETTLSQGGEALWQRVLGTEWGGMNEVLFNLYDITGNPTYIKTGRYFNHWVWSAPLAAGVDDLNHNHANTHIPEIIGNAKGYEVSGNLTDKAIALNFFDALTQNHTYATAGSNDGEYWHMPAQLGSTLNDRTEESCTQYNTLKLARHLYLWTANSTLFDFYERAILNGILGNQNHLDQAMTSFIYFLPLGGGGVTKLWGRSDFSFPCCWGTLSEQFSKLADSIFFQSADHSTVYVNQFVSASVDWLEQQ
eukprot:gene28201-34913_t